MRDRSSEQPVVGLDIGSHTTKGVVGRVSQGQIRLLAAHAEPTVGVTRGRVTDLEGCAATVNKVLRQLSITCGSEITDVHLQICTPDTCAISRTGFVEIVRESQQIKMADLREARRRAERLPLLGSDAKQLEIIQSIPQGFFVDDIRVQDPLQLAGSRLAAQAFVIAEARANMMNVYNALRKAGLRTIQGMWFGPLAAAEMALTPEEQAMGAVLLDIGYEKTAALVVSGGRLRGFHCFPVGVRSVIEDIATCCSVPREQALALLLEHGAASFLSVPTQRLAERIKVNFDTTSRQIPVKMLTEIIFDRLDETFTLVRNGLNGGNYRNLRVSTVVLCGGGSKIPGVGETATGVFGCSTFRIFLPKVEGPSIASSAEFATVLGLLRLASDDRTTIRSRYASDHLLARIGQLFREIC